MSASTGTDGPDAALDAALTDALAASTRSYLTLDEMWAAAHRCEPELAWAVDRRQRLADSLGRLADAGAITYSNASRSQDRDGKPALPKRIRDANAAAPVPAPARAVASSAWLPELAAAHQLASPRPEELATLHAINAWLRDRAADEPVRPLRERSWQIFGDEKKLDGVVAQRLFRDGILTLELLRAEIVHPPFVYTRVAKHGRAFVCENHQTYHSAAQVLREDPRDYAVAGYGAGRQFQAAVSYTADLNITGAVVYFGDLDADGLAIAAGAAREAERLGLPPVVPATGLYELLLTQPRRSKGKTLSSAAAAELVSWLVPEQRAAVCELFTAGHRIPQEAIGAPEMRAAYVWV